MIPVDLTRSLISMEDVQHKIGAITPDSLILDTNFRIVLMSSRISEELGYTGAELSGMPFATLASERVQHELQSKLQDGFLESKEFILRDRTGRKASFEMAGFYLGLVSDVNGLIILKIQKAGSDKDKLSFEHAELERFVYQSAHCLRGPLATLMGLIQLAQLDRDPQTVMTLIDHMEAQARRIDDKLHRLIIMADVDNELDPIPHHAPLSEVEEQFRLFIENQGHIKPPKVEFETATPEVVVNDKLVATVLENIHTLLCQIPLHNNTSVRYSSRLNRDQIELTYTVTGYGVGIAQLQKADEGRSYSGMLDNPLLINLSTARKIVRKLNGHIQFLFPAPEHVMVCITLPKPR